MAKRDVSTDPAHSAEATRGFPNPAVKADDFARRATVEAWTNAAAPPPAMTAKVHLRKGDTSMTIEAVTRMPATTAAGEAIRSRK